MKYLVGAACVVIIAAGSVYLTGQYNAYAAREAERQAALDAALERVKENNAKITANAKFEKELQDARDDDRLAKIGQKGCDQAAIDVVWVSTTRPIKKSDDIPAQIRQDIRTCLKHDKVAASDVAKIKAAGLYELAVN